MPFLNLNISLSFIVKQTIFVSYRSPNNPNTSLLDYYCLSRSFKMLFLIKVNNETLMTTNDILSVHDVMLMRLDVLVQRHELGDPLHPGDNEAEGEGVSAQGAVALCSQDAVNEAQTEGEAVVVVLLEPERQTGGQTQMSYRKDNG